LAAIEKLKDLGELQPLITRFQLTEMAFFGFDSTQDLDDSTQGIADVGQGGLGLPDRDYYTRSDENQSSYALTT
jgi:predicted metalloendopeptidase